MSARAAPRTVEELTREAAILAGAGPAILMQIAHRPVAAGIAAHSRFTQDPVDRLLHTLQYVYAVALPEAAPARDAVIGWVRRSHGPVHGVDASGRPYSAVDPDAQLWVAATLYWAADQVRLRIWGVLEDADAEALYRQDAELGTALQVPPERWPADRAAFARYWDAAVGTLEVTEEARQICRELLAARSAPAWIRVLMPVVRFVTAGMLPAPVRVQLGLDWDGTDSRREARLWAVVRRVYPLLPPRLRRAPSRWVVRTMPGM